MIDRNEGHVVTISSMAGKGGSHFLTDYWYVLLYIVFFSMNNKIHRRIGWDRFAVMKLGDYEFQWGMDVW